MEKKSKFFEKIRRVAARIPKAKVKKQKDKQKKKQQEETAVQQIVNHYFFTKGLTLEKIKRDAKKRKIVYSRFVRPAKQLWVLAGSVRKAKRALDTVAA